MDEGMGFPRATGFAPSPRVWDFRSHWFCRTICTSDRYEFYYDDQGLRNLWEQRFKHMGIPEMPHLDVLAEIERKKTFLDRGLPHVHIQSQELRAALTRWNNIVNEFTKQLLTFQTDRLAAIAGIAKRYQSSFQANYLAGIWESTIP
jgi:hypothetical protein